MGKVLITTDMTVGRILIFYPQLFGTLLTMGLCCVDESTAMWTMEQLAADIGMTADELCAVLNSLV